MKISIKVINVFEKNIDNAIYFNSFEMFGKVSCLYGIYLEIRRIFRIIPSIGNV